MKVIVYGSQNNAVYTPEEIKKCKKFGEFLAKKGCEILTGACTGYPYFVGKAAVAKGARVIGYSPGINEEEHVNVYKFLTDGVNEMVYNEVKYPSMSESYLRRSMDMTSFSDIVVAMGGSWGTFSELLLSFMLKRTIIMIEEFEGAVKAFKDVYDFMGARDINPAVHNGAKLIYVKTVDEAITLMSKLI